MTLGRPGAYAGSTAAGTAQRGIDAGALAKRVLLITLLLPLPAAGQDCGPLAIRPFRVRRAHVGFPVDAQVILKQFCGLITFAKVAGPPEFNLDGAGGLIYWIPAREGRETITFSVTQTLDGQVRTITKTFRTRVDDNTLTYPLFRDYLSQASTVPIQGRVHRPSFRLEYAEAWLPDERHSIPARLGPIEQTGRLGDWDISALPDGGRFLLTLRAGGSTLTNRVIIDRTAKPGWPKRIGPITHSPVLADLDDDGEQEVIVVTHFGELYVWRIDGTDVFEVAGVPASGAYSGPAVEDGYLVERSATGAAWSWARIAELPAGSTTYVDTSGGGAYRVRARRFDPRTGAEILSAASVLAGS